MMGSWWLLWMLFMFVFLLTPIGYGWGYRGWGAPYPSYIQRRRAQRADASGFIPHNHLAWGAGGDLLWMVLCIGFFWVCLAMWWH
jgi:hypothetical protein